MVVYMWLSTHDSYKGMLMLLENDVDVCVDSIYNMVLMVEIYEKDMWDVIERYYDTMAQATLNSALHSRHKNDIRAITKRYKGDK